MTGEGELKKQIFTIGNFSIGSVWTQKQISDIINEAKKDFPKKVYFDHPDPENPLEPANDASEFYVWFEKWFGDGESSTDL